MARTAVTLSLSLPPEVAARLREIGRSTGRTAARVAAEMVRAAAAVELPKRGASCCVDSSLDVPPGQDYRCGTCHAQWRWTAAGGWNLGSIGSSDVEEDDRGKAGARPLRSHSAICRACGLVVTVRPLREGATVDDATFFEVVAHRRVSQPSPGRVTPGEWCSGGGDVIARAAVHAEVRR